MSAADDAALGDRLAARTLELIDIPSESRSEAELHAHLLALLERSGLVARDLGDTALMAWPPGDRGDRPRVLLAGHLDTVPAQDNRPGRRDADWVQGLGAADMKGALAVMVELGATLAAAADAPRALDVGLLFFGREELPLAESALTPLLARDRDGLAAELVVMGEPTDNELHAGCLGNINATWTFRGRSGHSARPWTAENAIHAAAAGIVALAAAPYDEHEWDGLKFVEAASVTRVAGGIAGNVIPDVATAHVNFRYAPGRNPAGAEARLRELTAGHGELRIDSNAPSAPVPAGNRLLEALRRVGSLPLRPKQAWTPVAEFAAFGLDAVNFGPGAPSEAHRRDEKVAIAALVRCFRVLEALVRAGA